MLTQMWTNIIIFKICFNIYLLFNENVFKYKQYLYISTKKKIYISIIDNHFIKN